MLAAFVATLGVTVSCSSGRDTVIPPTNPNPHLVIPIRGTEQALVTDLRRQARLLTVDGKEWQIGGPLSDGDQPGGTFGRLVVTPCAPTLSFGFNVELATSVPLRLEHVVPIVDISARSTVRVISDDRRIIMGGFLGPLRDSVAVDPSTLPSILGSEIKPGQKQTILVAVEWSPRANCKGRIAGFALLYRSKASGGRAYALILPWQQVSPGIGEDESASQAKDAQVLALIRELR